MIILITVAFFGALSWAWMQNTRSGITWLNNEKSKADTIALAKCQNHIEAATERLNSRGCAGFISTDVTGALLGVPGEPTDGSCALYHPRGGGIKECGVVVASGNPEACLATLNVGQSCIGAVYAGLIGGVRLYAAATDLAPTTWNNGSGTMPNVPGATSNTDGFANTNAILAFAGGGTPYRAAVNCRALGPKWYLPAPAELQLLEDVKNIGVFNATFNTSGGGASRYWSSRQINSAEVRAIRLVDGSADDRDKDDVLNVRCVRRD